MTLGGRIKQLRKKAGLTQSELGKYLKVGKSTISQYETNTNMPDSDMILKIANFFDVSTDYLLGRTNTPPSRQARRQNRTFPHRVFISRRHKLKRTGKNYQPRCKKSTKRERKQKWRRYLKLLKKSR